MSHLKFLTDFESLHFSCLINVAERHCWPYVNMTVTGRKMNNLLHLAVSLFLVNSHYFI